MQLNYPISIPATNELEGNAKASALSTIAAHLNAESLTIIAKAAKKPGADKKLKQYQSFL